MNHSEVNAAIALIVWYLDKASGGPHLDSFHKWVLLIAYGENETFACPTNGTRSATMSFSGSLRISKRLAGSHAFSTPLVKATSFLQTLETIITTGRKVKARTTRSSLMKEGSC